MNYLAADNIDSLAQHYWSLSVEEQFYLVWPVLLLAVAVAGRRWWRAQPRRSVLTVAVVVFACSLAWSVSYTSLAPAPAYFVTTTRLWEFAVGAIVATMPLQAVGGAKLRAVVSWLAGAAIAVSAVAYNASTPFPGSAALLPVLATGVLLWAGVGAASWGPQLFARFRVVRYLGDVSYSLYLWHWPVIVVFAVMVGRPPGWKWAPILGLIALGLAALTKRWIEDPARTAGGVWRRPRWTLVATASAMAIVLVTTSVTSTQVSASASDNVAAARDALDHDEPCLGADAVLSGCPDPYAVTDLVVPWSPVATEYGSRGAGEWRCEITENVERAETSCRDGEATSGRIAVWGDSHAEQYISAFREVSEATGASIDLYARATCPAFGAPVPQALPPDEACERWRDDVLADLVADPAVGTVVMTGRFEVQRDGSDDARRTFAVLRDAGKRVVLIRDLPGTSHPYGNIDGAVPAPLCVERAGRAADPCAWQPGTWVDWATRAALDDGVTVIDPWEVLCADDACHIVIGGLIAYADSNHITASFGETLAPWLEAELRAARALPGA